MALYGRHCPLAIIAVFAPDLFFGENAGKFFAFLGVVFAPVCGIQIVDYFFLRKQTSNTHGLYESQTGSAYYFIGGINPVAFIAVIVGIFIYTNLLHPVSYESGALFKYISASIPALMVSAVLYFILTKLFCVKTNIGSYKKN